MAVFYFNGIFRIFVNVLYCNIQFAQAHHIVYDGHQLFRVTPELHNQKIWYLSSAILIVYAIHEKPGWVQNVFHISIIEYIFERIYIVI